MQEPSPSSVLLVDDHPGNLVALQAILEPLGARLVYARSGEEALRRVLEEDFVLILLDVRMPHVDGIETARLIRQRERTRHIPILFLTAAREEEVELLQGYAQGAVDYMIKPFDDEILRAKVEAFLRIHQHSELRYARERDLRREENQALRMAEERRRTALVEASAQAVWSAGREGNILEGAPSLAAFTGLHRREVPGNWLELLHPDDAGPARDTWRQAVEAQDRLALECRIPRGPDAWARVQLRAVPVQRPGAPPREWMVAVTDVTDRRRSEWGARFLAKASAMLGTTLDVDATVKTVTDLTVPDLADWAAAELVEPDGVIRRLAVASPDPIYLAKVQALRRSYPVNPSAALGQGAVIRTGKAEWAHEISDSMLVKVAQDEKMLELLRDLKIRSYVSVPLVSRGHVLGVLTLLYSGSGRRYTEAELQLAEDLGRRAGAAIDNARLYYQAQEAVRLRDEFLSVASHELKTPLTPLQLRLNGLHRAAQALKGGGPVRLAADLDVAQRQVRKLAELINNLLDVSRITSGTLQLAPEDLDLSALVREVVTRFEPQAIQTGSAVQLDAPGALPGRWDRLALEQVVTNLLANALKYGLGKPIRVRVWTDPRGIWIQVKDEGIGIPRPELKRIFGRFERAVSERHYGGLGLGLYITHYLVQRMAGEINVESDLGHGASFDVRLPAPG